MEHLVEQLVLSQFWCLRSAFKVFKEVHHQVLIILIEIGYLKVNHVVVLNTVVVNDLLVIFTQAFMSVSQYLLLRFDRRFNSDETFKLFYCSVGRNFDVIELVLLPQILDEQSKHL